MPEKDKSVASLPLKRFRIPDVLKGIGILLVVIGHVFRGLINGSVNADFAWLHAIDTGIYSFHMSLFFFVSGWLFAQTHRKGLSIGQALVSRLWTLFYLYVLWSLLQGGTQVMLSSYTTTKTNWLDLAEILWRPHDHFWFLHELFIVTFLGAVFLFRASSFFSYTVLSLALVLCLLFPHGLLSVWFIYYAIGYVLHPYLTGLDTRKMGRGDIKWLALVCAGFIGWQYFLQSVPAFSDAIPVVLFSSVIGTGLCLHVSLFLKGRVSDALAFLGKRTLPIYLAHVFFTAGMRIFLLKVLQIDDPTFQLIAGIGAGVFCPIILFYLTQRIGPNFLFKAPRLFSGEVKVSKS